MPRTAETASFQFNHTMIRVRDPDISVKFYTEVRVIRKLSKTRIVHLLFVLCRSLAWIFYLVRDEPRIFMCRSLFSGLWLLSLPTEKDMGDFTLYFLAFDQGQNYKDMSAEEKDKARFAREGVLELTHNHGTETDASFAGYSSGNSEPGKGFGHIAITVDDVEEACARFEKLGVQFKKRPQDGKMRHIAFILDPDGYWIEVVPSTLKL